MDMNMDKDMDMDSNNAEMDIDVKKVMNMDIDMDVDLNDADMDMDVNKLPVEILEVVFGKMKMKSLKRCRLVCSKWDREISSHGRLKIMIDDTVNGNLEFFNGTNGTRILKITSLDLNNYKDLRTHSFRTLEELDFRFKLQATPNINLKFFSDHCNSLKSLTIHQNSLCSCDFDDKAGGFVQPYSLFNNLQELDLYAHFSIEEICSGRIIQLVSKNLQFMLQVIGSQKLKKLLVRLNESYIDVNCCEARSNYRFEDSILPKFLCRQPEIEVVDLGLPSSMPDEVLQLQYPKVIERFCVENRCGVCEGISREPLQQLQDIELLAWDEDFYDPLRIQMKSAFWKGSLLAQTKLDTLYYIGNGNFGSADFPIRIIQNNSTLRELCVEIALHGTIDVSLFGNCILEELLLWNVLLDDLQQGEEDECEIKNIKYLPKTVRQFSIRNITITPEEFMDICQVKSLKDIDISFEEEHYLKIATLPNFIQVMSLLARERNLRKLVIGRLYLDTLSPEVLNFTGSLADFYDEIEDCFRIESEDESSCYF